MRTNLILLFACLSFTTYSQTLEPPTILCVTTLSSGDVTVNWLPPAPDPCGAFTAFMLYGSTNIAGPYLRIDSITNFSQTSTVHTGANGTILDWHYFMITLRNCPGATSPSSDTITEEVLLTPEIDYVTVLPDGSIRLQWFPVASSQAAGYVIYYEDDGGFATAFDTAFGINNTTYTDFNADPDTGSVAYTVAAFDDCKNPTPFNDSAHHTIFLTASILPCVQEAALVWTPYKHWDGIASYNIETSIDNAPFSVANTFPDLSYGFDFSLEGLAADTICFRIAAIRQGDNITSHSNIVCFPYNLTRPTAFNHLRNVSVNMAGGVDLEWYIDTAAVVTSFTIGRSADGNSFSSVADLPVSNPPLLNSYTDAGAPASSGSLHYRVTSLDNCDFSLPSSPGKTIFLSGVNTGTVNRLTWNAFELEHATVLNYTIYRVENGALVPDTTVPPTTFTHDDFVATDLTGDGSFCYVARATFSLEIPGFPGETLESASNQFCIYPPPVIFVPNAFVPGGKNTIFKPTLQNPNVAEYEFLIFDRWGKQIFQTGLVNVGWDGSLNGERLPLGGYAYYVRVVSPGGVTAEKKGTVVLVR